MVGMALGLPYGIFVFLELVAAVYLSETCQKTPWAQLQLGVHLVC